MKRNGKQQGGVGNTRKSLFNLGMCFPLDLEEGKKDFFAGFVNSRKDNKNSAVLKGLNLDTSEPWERSLMKQLKEDTTTRQQQQKTNVEQKQQQQQQQQQQNQHNQQNQQQFPLPNVVLLKHTDSRDFAVEWDRDDVSLSSNMSISSRRSGIYRSKPSPTTAALFDEDDSLTMSSISYNKGHHRRLSSLEVHGLMIPTLDEHNKPNTDEAQETRGELEDDSSRVLSRNENNNYKNNFRIRRSSLQHQKPNQMIRRGSAQPVILKARALSDYSSSTMPIEKEDEKEVMDFMRAAPDFTYFCWGPNNPLEQILERRKSGTGATTTTTTATNNTMHFDEVHL